MLTWTREQPTAVGYYGVRCTLWEGVAVAQVYLNHKGEPCVLFCREGVRRLFGAWAASDPPDPARHGVYEWYGPLEFPA